MHASACGVGRLSKIGAPLTLVGTNLDRRQVECLTRPPLNGLRDVLSLEFVGRFWDGDEGWAFAATLVHLPKEAVHHTPEVGTVWFPRGVGCTDASIACRDLRLSYGAVFVRHVADDRRRDSEMLGDLFTGPAVAPELENCAIAPSPVSDRLAAKDGPVNKGGFGSAYDGDVSPACAGLGLGWRFAIVAVGRC